MVNPQRLSLARERRGYTKIQLAKKVGVDPRSITAYESGEFPPSPETLRQLAAVLDFPEEFFVGDDIEVLSPDGASFRSMTKMTASQRNMALAQGALAIHLAKWIEERFELPECTVPDLDRGQYRPETAAEAVRSLWGLGQLSIRNMIHLLESKGVRVFSLGINAREVDAFSVWKGGTPYVFLNVFKSAERSRFDAAHELAHLVLHKHASPNGREAEGEANRFAAAFLMPERSVYAAETPRNLNLNTIIGLKRKWTVSVAALAHRLHELELLTDWQYRSICIEIGQRFKNTEPNEAQRESSAILPKLFAYLFKEEGLKRGAIAEELAIPPAELEQLLFGLTMTALPGGRKTQKGGPAKKPGLSLVKE